MPRSITHTNKKQRHQTKSNTTFKSNSNSNSKSNAKSKANTKNKSNNFFGQISLNALQKKNLEFVAGALSISISRAYEICKKYNFDSNAILAKDVSQLKIKWSKKSTRASKHRTKNSPKKTDDIIIDNTDKTKPKQISNFIHSQSSSHSKSNRIPPIKHKPIPKIPNNAPIVFNAGKRKKKSLNTQRNKSLNYGNMYKYGKNYSKSNSYSFSHPNTGSIKYEQCDNRYFNNTSTSDEQYSLLSNGNNCTQFGDYYQNRTRDHGRSLYPKGRGRGRDKTQGRGRGSIRGRGRGRIRYNEDRNRNSKIINDSTIVQHKPSLSMSPPSDINYQPMNFKKNNTGNNQTFVNGSHNQRYNFDTYFQKNDSHSYYPKQKSNTNTAPISQQLKHHFRNNGSTNVPLPEENEEYEYFKTKDDAEYSHTTSPTDPLQSNDNSQHSSLLTSSNPSMTHSVEIQKRRPPILRNIECVNDMNQNEISSSVIANPMISMEDSASISSSVKLSNNRISEDCAAGRVFGILSNGGLVIVPPSTIPDIYKPFVLLPFDVLAKLANSQPNGTEVSAEQLLQWYYHQQKHLSYALSIGLNTQSTLPTFINDEKEKSDDQKNTESDIKCDNEMKTDVADNDTMVNVINKKCSTHPVLLKAHNTGSIKNLRQMRHQIHNQNNSNLNPSALLFMPSHDSITDNANARISKSTAVVPAMVKSLISQQYNCLNPIQYQSPLPLPLPIVSLPLPSTSISSISSPLSYIELGNQQSSPLPIPQSLSLNNSNIIQNHFSSNIYSQPTITVVPSLVNNVTIENNNIINQVPPNVNQFNPLQTMTVPITSSTVTNNIQLNSPIFDYNNNLLHHSNINNVTKPMIFHQPI